MADIPGDKELRQAKQRIVDMANALDHASGKAATFGGAFKDAVKTSEDLANSIEKLASKTERTAQESEKLKSLSIQFEKASDAAGVLTGVLKNKLSTAFDQLGKKIIKTWANLANSGIDKLEAGVKRVYQLYEKWTRALGEFRTRMGAAGSTMGASLKIAKQWEGTMHGLTGTFGQGIPMVAEFADGIQRALKDSDKSMAIFSLKVGQTFGLASDSVGQMVRSFENFGASSKDQKKIWGQIADQSDKAELNLGAFSNELVQSREFMVRFGKQGAKTFVESAAYVRKFGVSLKSLEGFYDLTDTFEGATKAAARLNTVFGTTINSLDLMLEQNPAKRFDQVRTSLLQQGKDIKNLMPQEIKLISETIGLTTDETNAMLQSGKTFGEYQKQKAKSVDVEKRVHDAMNKTALTMFSFSQAADKITTGIANAIKPFLQLIGLAGKGDKDFKSFSQVMGNITDKITAFFNGLGKNKQFQDFLIRAAGGVKKLASWIGDQLSPGKIQKTIDKIVDLFRTTFDWSKKIIAVWAGFKIFQGVGSVMTAFKKLNEAAKELRSLRSNVASGPGDSWMSGAMGNGVMQPGQQGPGAFGKMQKALGGGKGGALAGGLGGAAVGLAGVLSGQMTISQGVGTAIGSAMGGLIAGPIGAAVGGWLGEKGGGIVDGIIDSIKNSGLKKLKDEAEKSEAERKRRKGMSFEQIHTEEATKQLEDAKKSIIDTQNEKAVYKNHLYGQKADPKKIADFDAKIAKLASSIGGYEKQKREAEFDELKARRESTALLIQETKTRQSLDDLEKLRATEDFKKALTVAQSSGAMGQDAERQALKILSTSQSSYAKDAANIASNIYPVKAQSVATPRQPLNASPSASPSTPINYAKPSGKGSGTKSTPIIIQGGDVVLDGKKVGRQLTRTTLVDVGQ